MRQLARHTSVLWVNSIGMRFPTPGRTSLPMRRYLRKLMSTLKGLRRDPSGIWVLSPLFIPSYTRRAMRLNGYLLRAQVTLLLRVLGIHRPAAWVTLPTALYAIEGPPWTRIVFNRSDRFSAFPEVDREKILELEHRLLARADHVVYVNRRLFEEERSLVKRSSYLGHGVDFEHFASHRATERGLPPAPQAMRDLPRPIVGFYGALDDYTIDLRLLIQVARQIRNGTLLVIGPKAMDISGLEAEPNVRYLGPIPYEALPLYAAQFDVALMPWLRNEWIESCNPIKLKEYLALGLPTVTIRFPELEPFKSLVYAADTHEQFLAGVKAALAEQGSALRERRSAVVQGSRWENLAKRVAELLELPET
jgi:hypothetical protein